MEKNIDVADLVFDECVLSSTRNVHGTLTIIDPFSRQPGEDVDAYSARIRVLSDRVLCQDRRITLDVLAEERARAAHMLTLVCEWISTEPVFAALLERGRNVPDTQANKPQWFPMSSHDWLAPENEERVRQEKARIIRWFQESTSAPRYSRLVIGITLPDHMEENNRNGEPRRYLWNFITILHRPNYTAEEGHYYNIRENCAVCLQRNDGMWCDEHDDYLVQAGRLNPRE